MNNNMYRFTGNGYEDLRECQCLSCKNCHFCNDGEIYDFCPWCGTRLLKLFNRKNKRYDKYRYTWKRRFPYINFYICKLITQKLADNGFYAVDIKPYIKWQLDGQIDSEDFVGNREKQGVWLEFPYLFKEHANKLTKDIDNISVKAVINRWDGSNKEIILK